MRMLDLIVKKRDGGILDKNEINFIVNGYTLNKIPDYQMSAFLMSVFYKSLNEQELSDLTMSMVDSGDKVDLSSINGIKVDKHSTGGVGDTTTLVLAPLVASLGVPVAKMSGRGLGHTGGTIDKLESIPGFHVELTADEFTRLVNDYKVAVIGQTGNLAPADKKIYALRDVTGTVESIPLIASSIMSKKIASGADAIVLDIKTGSGAFMKTVESSIKLAEAMVNIGALVGRKTVAVISDMSQPLGRAIGNSIEVEEAILTLKGEGPKDLEELCIVLGSRMVCLAGKATTEQEASQMLKEAIASGKALEKFKQFVANQGGNPKVAEDVTLLPQAKYKIELPARTSGVVSSMEASNIGTAAMLLGAGRATKDSVLDISVGLMLNKKIGDSVIEGESLVTIHSNKEDVSSVKDLLYKNICISDNAVKPILIHGSVTK